MRAFSSKSYKYPFFLDEQELRRINDLLLQQFAKHVKNTSFNTEFTLRFRNGVISKHSSIVNVFEQENTGSSAIERITIDYFDQKENPINEIILQFTDPKREFDDDTIRFLVIGDDQDWVFIMSSHLEERIKKIQRFSIQRFVKPNLSGIINYILGSIGFVFIGVLLSAMIGSRLFVVPDLPKPYYETLNDIEAAWKAGEIKDPIEAIIRIERRKEDVFPKDTPERLQAKAQRQRFEDTCLLLLIVAPFLLLLSWYFFPPYVFYWGENIKLIDRRQNAGKFIFLTIVLALILGVAGNYIYDSIKNQ